jgi:hypothetical protein
MNFRLLENNWFDWDCPNYLKWREALIEKTIWEGNQRGFKGNKDQFTTVSFGMTINFSTYRCPGMNLR